MKVIWDGTMNYCEGMLTTCPLKEKAPQVDPDYVPANCSVCGKEYMKLEMVMKTICSERCRKASM